METKKLDLLLIGKTGMGKSATGNTILGQDYFYASSCATSVTKDVDSWIVEFEEYIIKVVDTPGLADTDGIENPAAAAKVVMEKMRNAVILHPSGFHAFLWVIKFGERCTPEDFDCMKLLKHIFGQQFVKNYCILIMTFGDDFQHHSEDFQTWYRKQSGTLGQLITECNDRILLFENGCVKQKRVQQIRELVEMVNRLGNEGNRYTNEHFKEAEASRNAIMNEIINEDILNEIILVQQKLNQFSKDKDSRLNQNLTSLKDRADRLRCKVKSVECKSVAVLSKLCESIYSSALLLSRFVDAESSSEQSHVELMTEVTKIETELRNLSVRLRNADEAKPTSLKDCEERKQKIHKEVEQERQELRNSLKATKTKYDSLLLTESSEMKKDLKLERDREMLLYHQKMEEISRKETTMLNEMEKENKKRVKSLPEDKSGILYLDKSNEINLQQDSLENIERKLNKLIEHYGLVIIELKKMNSSAMKTKKKCIIL